MRVCVVGAGYVGLVTGAGLAEHGHDVTCVDPDPPKVIAVNSARPPIFEQGLDNLLRRHVPGRLRATTDLDPVVIDSDIVIVCVGTPSRPDGSMDTSALETAVGQIGAVLRSAPARSAPRSVVIKSTVVPGTTDGLLTERLEAASGLRAGVDFGVGANPEFLTEGQAVADFLQPDRIVIGGDDLARAALHRLYAGFTGVPVVAANSRTAEMVKYSSNAMLATAISFSNELSDLAENVGGVDMVEVMNAVHLSRYLTSQNDATPVRAGLATFFEAGCGYGGSCLPKDVAALSALGRAVSSPTPLLDAVAVVNAARPTRLMTSLQASLGPVGGRQVSVLGLAFKPDTDDTRFSPAFPVVRSLLAEGALVTVHDPIVGPQALGDLAEQVVHTHDLTTAVRHAEAVVVVTRWADYLTLPEIVATLDPPPMVFDGRRMLDAATLPRYAGIGLAPWRPTPRIPAQQSGGLEQLEVITTDRVRMAVPEGR